MTPKARTTAEAVMRAAPALLAVEVPSARVVVEVSEVHRFSFVFRSI
jgi:hypothetical protein